MGYASTERAKLMGLGDTIMKAEDKIKELSGKTPNGVIFALLKGEYNKNPNLKNKLYRLLNKIQDAEGQILGIGELGAFSDVQTAGKADIKEVYLDMDNPYIYDMGAKDYREESYASIIKKAKQLGHDGVIIKNTIDPGSRATGAEELTDIKVVFNENQIKTRQKLIDIWNKAHNEI